MTAPTENGKAQELRDEINPILANLGTITRGNAQAWAEIYKLQDAIDAAFAHPVAQPASGGEAVGEALRLAKDALEESHNDVVNTLNSYVDHPANSGKRRLIQNQIDAHCDAIKAVDAAQAVQANPRDIGGTEITGDVQL